MSKLGGERGMTKPCLVLVVAVLLTINRVECNPETVFDVMKFGAKANGMFDDGNAIIRAWNDACKSTGAAKVLIPAGEYKAGEIVFAGPCTCPDITIEIQGTLLANTDVSTYTQGAWIMVERVDGVLITGDGTINGRGKSSWEFADNNSDSPLTVSMRFECVTNTKLNHLNFVDSMGFHISVVDSNDIDLSNLKITAPENSPNTDGLHLSNSTNVNIIDSIIETGNDCVSICNGSKKVTVSGVECSPGHGISVWSQGQIEDVTNLKEVTILNSKLEATIKLDHPSF